MIKKLFIGSFLSSRRGTKTIAEKIEVALRDDVPIQLVSKFENKLVRIVDIIRACLIYRGKLVHIEVFSGKSFFITAIASFILRIRSKKMIFILRGGKLPEFYKSYPAFFRRTLKRADVLETPSKYLQEFFLKNEISLNYLPNPINLKKFKYNPKPKPKTILWVRSFEVTYNPFFPIKIFLLLKNSYPEARLTMIGPDKGLLKPVQNEIYALGLEKNIELLGPIDNDSLPEFYTSHAVYLNTYQYETFGTAVLEAAASGVPIVSSKKCEIGYLWEHEKNMLLTDEDTPLDFCKNVIRLFEDSTLAEHLRRNARLRAESFDWEKIIPVWKTRLSEIE